MCSALNFYLCLARIFIVEVVLLVKPKVNRVPEKGTTGLAYLFDKHSILETHNLMVFDETNFVYNGMDYYAPFF